MVVLELEGHNMLGSGPNQYLQPDYLSPLASPLDSKVSPLALLAQTCSQIGADGPSSKSIFETSKRKLSTCSESSIKSESSDSKDSVNNNSKEYSSGGGGGSNSHSNNNSGGNGSGSSRPKSSSSCSSLSGVNNTTSSSSSSNNKSSHNGGKSSPVLSPNGHSPVFKPYEITKSSKETSSEKHSERSSSKSKHHHQRESLSSLSRGSANCSPKAKTPNLRSSPDNSKNESHSSSEPKKSSNSSGNGSDRSNTVEQSKPSPDNGAGSSPIIRSGLEVLQQGQFGSSSAAAEYNRKLSALHSLSALGGYPPGFDPMNPAFRPPFMGPPHPHAAHMGYALPGSSPYVSYSRVKTASGAETIVPVCKDPYCTGCQYGGGGAPHGASSGGGGQSTSNMNGLMAAAAAAAAAAGFPGFGGASSPAAQASLICPAGCVQCDHPKFPLSSFPHLFGLGGGGAGGSPHPSLASLGGYPSSLLSQHSAAVAAHSAAAAQQQQNAQRPYVCNWIVGDNYCGKRFPSSEELLQHLRTHTNSSGSASSSSGADSAALAAMVQQQHQIALSHAAAGVSSSNALYSNALLNQSAMAAAAAAMHRTYPTPPLSPLSAARYHPYAKASGLSSNSASPGSVAAAAALSSYYPYSAAAAAALYGQRLGPSVHP
ncbi:Zinc finger protein-likeNoc [Orchesella cincta]|uniref:Zinc finger protein-likeNoc n=1 Tax=Orchesella cincta TaxID=48709 RepID=A0A1D2MJS3_ORCCI|nr:Zinc finger protein-likeNoc [Orchesella cincta]